MATNEEVIVDSPEETEVQTEESTTQEANKPEAQAEKPKETPEAKKARLERQLAKVNKELGEEKEKPAGETESSKPTTGDLDDVQLEILELKGITEQEDIDVIQSVMERTGQSLREALKDDYVTSKLATLKKKREVTAATPGSTRRAGSDASDSEEYWFQKYEQDGALPTGMPNGMAAKLVQRKSAQSDPRKNPYE